MLDIALKEWAVITDLLLSGDQVILLRKGGIHEDDGPGRFRLENERFALFPAWEHQKTDWVKPEYQSMVGEFDSEPQSFQIKGIGTVTPGISGRCRLAKRLIHWMICTHGFRRRLICGLITSRSGRCI